MYDRLSKETDFTGCRLSDILRMPTSITVKPRSTATSPTRAGMPTQPINQWSRELE